MFDGIISTVQGFAMNIIWFAVAGFVGSAIWQFVPGTGAGFDVMWSVMIAANAAAAALLTALVVGAAKSG